jgi:hypothetical protein
VDRASRAPSPKRPRTENAPSTTEEVSEEQGVGSQSDSVRQRTHDESNKEVMESDESTDDSAEDNEFFLDSLARENENLEMVSMGAGNKWLTTCPILQQQKLIPVMENLQQVVVLHP